MARVRFTRHPGGALGRVTPPDDARLSGRPASGRWRRLARGAARCRRGTYTLEFALLAPVFIPVLIGVLETCWRSSIALAVENAAMETARFASLGRKNADGSRSGSTCLADIKNAAVAAGRGLLSSNRLTLTPRFYATAAEMVGDKDFTKGTTGTGGAGALVRFRLEYTQPLLVPFVAKMSLFGGKQTLTHVRMATVKNEPYPDATTATSC